MTKRPHTPAIAPTARTLAAAVLVRVHKDGAFASAALESALASHPDLDPRDRGLATEIVYGALRTGPYLESRLAAFAPRGLGKLDETVRAHLVVGAYQLAFLDRVPAFAAVSEAVSIVRTLRGRQLSAFANALLRRFSEAIEKGPRPTIAEAVRASAAPWLTVALTRALGAGGAGEFLGAGPVPPPIGLRIPLGADRDAWIARLAAAAPDAEIAAGRVSPLAINVRGAGDPRRLPGIAEGELTVQEEGSQLVALAVGASAGDRVLDACAGRGNKTSLLAQAVGAKGAVDAADLHEQKLDRLRTELSRSGLAPRSTYAVDWTVGPGDVPAGYDRVLVDAPCSGVGTIRRRPEIVTHRTGADLAALAEIQAKIVTAASTRLRAGGTLVYAVCSVLREEGEDVVERVVASGARLVPAALPEVVTRGVAGATAVRLLPQVEGTDGYFVAAFVKG